MVPALFVSSLYIILSSVVCSGNNENLQTKLPTVAFTVLIRNKAHTLPYFFSCLEALDYPKERIFMWIYSDYNEDKSAELIEKWLKNYGKLYYGVNITIDNNAGPLIADENKPNEWTKGHFQHVINLREKGLTFARNQWADFAFMIDADVFLTDPMTLKTLVSKNLVLASPMLTSDGRYSNFWSGMDENFYYKRTKSYDAILLGEEIGCFIVPMIHTAVLINLNIVGSDKLTYDSKKLDNYQGPEDDIIIFAISAKQNNIPLYICNDYEYGYIPVPLEHDDEPENDFEQLINVKLEAISKGQPIILNKVFEEDVQYPQKWKFECDEIYMINLKKREERKFLMEESFKELGIEAQYFLAVDGKNLNNDVLTEYNIKLMKNYEDPYHQRPMKMGEIGCFVSHYLIWQEMVELGHKTTLILEDDLHFVPYFRHKFLTLLKELKNLPWDLVYIGRKVLLDKEEVHVSRHIVKPLYSYWTLGYLLSLEGAKKLLDAKPLEKMLPVDEFLPIMFDQHPNNTWKSYFPTRNLVAYSASPLLVYPTHYTHDIGYISDTEDSEILSDISLKAGSIKIEL